MTEQNFLPYGSKPELLAPGGSLEKCMVAFLYGADAVYCGGKEHSLRAFATNLGDEEIAQVTCQAHLTGKKIYVTVNAFARESDTALIPDYLAYIRDIGVDGIIISDPGVFLLARRIAPSIPIHLSTQANTTNSLSVRFWEELGVKRINIAREIGIDELAAISRNSTAELESFVHGAMCVSVSGRCLLSAALNKRSANRGLCTQPCRWSYRLVEEKRPGEYFPIFQDEHGSYIFNSRDLCLINKVGELAAIGVNSMKIEGRMKGLLYLASVVRTYRKAIDSLETGEYKVQKNWLEDLEQISHRPYTTGMLYADKDGNGELSPTLSYIQTHTLAGIVRPAPEQLGKEFAASASREHRESCIEVRTRIATGSKLDFLDPDGSNHQHSLDEFYSMNGQRLEFANPNTWIRVRLPFKTFPLQVVRTPTGKN